MSKSTRLSEIPFASAERVPIEIIHRQAVDCAQPPLQSELLSSVLNYVFVVNEQGQIVFASPNIPSLVLDKTAQQLLGSRLGEVLSCVNAQNATGGCGTSEACRDCGAVQAIVSSLAGHGALREYRVTRLIGCEQQTSNFVAMAAPLVYNQQRFSLLSLTDSSNVQARQALRRFFRRLQK
jgi:hypothetical protein